eukprot:gene21960-66721_t
MCEGGVAPSVTLFPTVPPRQSDHLPLMNAFGSNDNNY